MRLNKFISNSGYCSRRNADTLIKEGKVTVNGSVIYNIGHDVADDDYVKVEGKLISENNRLVYFVLNKPKGYLSSNYDKHHDQLARDLIHYKGKLNYVGRLDLDSEGLLIFTNDGEFTNIMTHPSFNISKKYLVYIDEYVPDDILTKIEGGVMLDDGMTKECKILVKDRNKYKTKLEIQISEGKNRQIRRMFEYFDFKVTKLVRIMHGKISLGNLSSGEYRQFDKNEIQYVKELIETHDKRYKKLKRAD